MAIEVSASDIRLSTTRDHHLLDDGSIIFELRGVRAFFGYVLLSILLFDRSVVLWYGKWKPVVGLDHVQSPAVHELPTDGINCQPKG